MTAIMKELIIFICFILFVNISGQEIYFSRDTLRIDNNNYQDSIVIYNGGLSLLKIDSIKCINTNYTLNIGFINQSNEWKMMDEFVDPTNAIEILPTDSTIVRFAIGSVLVKQNKFDYDQIDTMYFYNNSKNSQLKSLVITNKYLMGDVEDEVIPDDFCLYQNYPNPFNPITKIQYTISRADFVSLKVYDILGKEIASLVNDYKNAGEYEVKFNAYGLSSGIYFYALTSGKYRDTNKMILLK